MCELSIHYILHSDRQKTGDFVAAWCTALRNCAPQHHQWQAGQFSTKLEIYRAILNTMVVLRHLIGSDPSIQVADDDCLGNAAVTLHFEARPPKAALSIEQDKRSVVITDAQLGRNPLPGDPADVTQVTRQRGVARWLSLRHWIILLESNWVVVAVGFSVFMLLFCAVRLRHM